MGNDAFSFRARSAGPNTVLGWGDSRTSSVPWEQVGSDNPSRLYSWANCGYGGLTVRGYLDYALTTFPGTNWGNPVGTVINLGTNNFWIDRDRSEFWSFESDLKALVYIASQIGQGRVALVTPSPIEAGFPATPNAAARVQIMQDVCDQIRNVAIAMSVPVIELALAPALRRQDGLAVTGTTIDGIHYSWQGQAAAKTITGQRLAETFF